MNIRVFPRTHPVDVAWCLAPSRAEELATFVFENLETSYISHSELQFGRADDIGRWAGNLYDLLLEEFAERLGQASDSDTRILVAQRNSTLVAIALVTFNRNVPVKHAVIEDLVVGRSERGQGIGQAVMTWILACARREGMQRAVLESGLSNERAHSFFERNNFHQVSVVMMADLNNS